MIRSLGLDGTRFDSATGRQMIELQDTLPGGTASARAHVSPFRALAPAVALGLRLSRVLGRPLRVVVDGVEMAPIDGRQER